ncbi:protein FAR1-RELATED SEQUENCE 5-like [Asparagus officinalis]|uniref:protein FAR1-RELATED SEQUENCE 5-like n=1 Tax=Asparagus officinalis TaxID=4686 RepID=UPI00098DF8FC|nr:protein FAR1-RELATED SEQUENCE 5-like [Asparagus officinalis]
MSSQCKYLNAHEGFPKNKGKERLLRDNKFEKSPSKEISSIQTGCKANQYPSMRKAISEVLPNMAHRFYKRHILQKAREHLGILFGTKEKFQEDFLSCINFSLTVEDFESSRVNTHTTIYEFVMQYEKALEDRFDVEEEEDFRSLQYKPSSWSPSLIERHAQKIYTRVMFKVFKDQLKEIFLFSLNEMEPKVLYKLVQVLNSNKPSARRRTYIVTFQAPTTVSCNCKMFEFSGMVCSHVLKVLLHLDILEIPSEYILKRWTKSAKEESFDTHQCLSTESSNSSSKTLTFNSLSQKIIKLVVEGSTCIELYNLKKRKMKRFKPPSEMKAKKQRTCGKCHGKGHNSRACKAQTTSHVGSINEEEEEDPEDQEEEDEDVEEYYY